jgi:hypothetical protein
MCRAHPRGCYAVQVRPDGVPLVGSWAYLKQDEPGCPTLDELDRLKEFAGRKDKPAFTRYFTDHCEPGLPAETKVRVEDFPSGTTRFVFAPLARLEIASGPQKTVLRRGHEGTFTWGLSGWKGNRPGAVPVPGPPSPRLSSASNASVLLGRFGKLGRLRPGYRLERTRLPNYRAAA